MPNGPIQVVLNTDNFVVSRDKGGGGGNKEFYLDENEEFVRHKTDICSQLNTIKAIQLKNRFSKISFAKLVLHQSALAKSHRPNQAIFKRDIAPIVGAGDLGDLYIELQPSSIDRLSSKIDKAEEETRWKAIKEDLQPNPSRLRSELGSIKEINPYTAADKRKFSVAEGLEWLSDPRTGGAYIIELFETSPAHQDWGNLSAEKIRLHQSFIDGLGSFETGLFASRLVGSGPKTAMIWVGLGESAEPSSVQLAPAQSTANHQTNIISVNQDSKKHAELLHFLESHPLVKKIVLPPIITQSQTLNPKPTNSPYSTPQMDENESYPVIGVVDGGISPLFDDWIEEKWGLLSSEDKNENHGTFIAGLAVSSAALNGPDICKEPDGCKIVDLDLLPKDNSFTSYYANPIEFFQELETAVRKSKKNTGVRIFNFSLNIEEHVSSDGYSLPAQKLDHIAEKNNVIFVVSAGNTSLIDRRKEWPSDILEAMSILATARNDILKKPAESCRNISVSALNPPNMKGIVPYAPSNYSCRGPGMRIGLKPELAHVGGAGTKTSEKGHGLYSTDPDGNLVDGCGTSYAAPHVAKTLACIEQSIEGEVSRETLTALSIHHAALPGVLTDRKFKDVAKHLVGFGIPGSSACILEGSENSITLVFENKIQRGRKMSFDFVWPPSLVKNGKCRGYAKLTLVSRPPFDYRFGSEFVRININGYLRQEQKNGNYSSRLTPIYLPENSSGKQHEKNQIDYAFKWSPVKVFEKRFRGVGPSTNWRLDIEYLTRGGEELPEIGVPFTALLTISDPENTQPVFNDMRQSLAALGVKTVDIQTAARVMSRV
ncbi:MAG: S8 family serine peptidase [Gammaproteobacteria bacterium]|nr:S8 family serine peptidase [Gammaproteobacteria bacterium]